MPAPSSVDAKDIGFWGIGARGGFRMEEEKEGVAWVTK